MYPIIEANGVDYYTLVTASGLSTSEIDGRTVSSDSRVVEVAKRLRSKFPGHTVTAMSYDWFHGVLRAIDGRGISNSYGYDAQGRLTSVRDFNNHLISKFEYRYATDEDEY